MSKAEVSLPKPTRTLDEIRAEYTRLSNKAGHCSYQIAVFQKDLDLLHGTMRDLNIEAAEASNREAEAAKTETPPNA